MERTRVTDVFAAIYNDDPQKAENLRVRSQLMDRIIAIVKSNNWTQQEAADKCGITQPRMNDLLKGKISKFSVDALINIHVCLGERLKISFYKEEEENKEEKEEVCI